MMNRGTRIILYMIYQSCRIFKIFYNYNIITKSKKILDADRINRELNIISSPDITDKIIKAKRIDKELNNITWDFQ